MRLERKFSNWNIYRFVDTGCCRTLMCVYPTCDISYKRNCHSVTGPLLLG
jgi:hypothetical protein